MISSFEIGAVFKIINRASPALTAMLRQVRALNEQIEKAKLSLLELGKSGAPSLLRPIAQTRTLAAEWQNVAKNAGAARTAITSASTAVARRSTAATAAGAAATTESAAAGRGAAGMASRFKFGHAHVSGPGAELPGGSHLRLGGAAGVTAGLFGYGAYQAAEMQNVIAKILYTEGLKPTAANQEKFKNIIQQAMLTSGYGVKEVGGAALNALQMLQGTPGGGVKILPELLRGAATESLLKPGTSLGEAVTALVGLAHMTKSYSPAAIAKLIPSFAFLSTANPSSLASMERAASYAVPILQSGLEIDPMQSLLMGTVLTRAGATNTKSGTWLRNLLIRAMPGTSLMSRKAFEKHEAALRALGLVDAHDRPTWFTNGKPDPYQLLKIASAHAASIPLTKRAAYEQQLFGAQGFGAFSLLADPKVREQIRELDAMRQSPAFHNRYSTFMGTFAQASTMQQARTALQQFNVTMMDLGTTVLPAVSGALKDFKGVLQSVASIIPGGTKGGTSTVGKRTLEGAIGGGLIGSIVPGVGTVGGAAIGGAAGAAEGFMEQYNKQHKDQSSFSLPAMPMRFVPGQDHVKLQPISLSLNIDGQTLAQAISQQLATLFGFQTGGPAGNGAARFGDSSPYDI